MSTTYTPTGTLTITPSFLNTASGDETGQIQAAFTAVLKTFNSSNVTISGYMYGTATCAAGDWLLAHASDPLGAMGNAGYSAGFTVASSKLKLLIVYNADSTNTITLTRKATTGLPIFGGDNHATTLSAGGVFVWCSPAGTAALTTTSNDALTIAVGGGSPTAYVLAAYGP